MTDFQKLVQGLEQAKVPCNVKLFSITGKYGAATTISVECGFNWPEEMFDQISAIAEAVDVPVSVCASVSGFAIVDQKKIAGGPKTYFPYNIKF